MAKRERATREGSKRERATWENRFSGRRKFSVPLQEQRAWLGVSACACVLVRACLGCVCVEGGEGGEGVRVHLSHTRL